MPQEILTTDIQAFRLEVGIDKEPSWPEPYVDSDDRSERVKLKAE
jgi:hypothetical protein